MPEPIVQSIVAVLRDAGPMTEAALLSRLADRGHDSARPAGRQDRSEGAAGADEPGGAGERSRFDRPSCTNRKGSDERSKKLPRLRVCRIEQCSGHAAGEENLIDMTDETVELVITDCRS